MTHRKHFVEGDHVDAGICHCEWAHVLLRGVRRAVRIASIHCGLSTHRVEAAANAELLRGD